MLAIKIPSPLMRSFLMMRDLQALAADLDVSHSVRARVPTVTTVADAEATQDLAPKVLTVRAVTTRVEATMVAFSVETAVDKEAVKEEAKEAVKEAAREAVKEEELQDTTTTTDMTTTTDTTTATRVEDLRLLVVAPETTTIMMTTGLVKDTTIKIMTIPAKIELAVATSAMLVEEDPLNNKTIMIIRAAMTTEDLSKTEETTTIKTIVQMMNTTDLPETTDLALPDLMTLRVATIVSQEVASEEATEEEIVEVSSEEIAAVSSEETEVATVVANSEVHQEVTSEVVTLLEAMVASAERVAATMALEELALTKNEERKF